MSGPFVTILTTEDVLVPCVCDGKHPNDVITVKNRFSGSDISEMDSAMFEVSGDGNPQANVGASNRKMMEIAVVGWSFTNEQGEPIPFDPELVNAIDARAWSVVVAHLNDRLGAVRNPTTQPDEKPKRQRTGRS